jgi:hypothetical protein
MRDLKEPGLGLGGARERATLVAEQLRFEEILGNRRAVDVDERAARPWTVAMHRARDEALARARLAAKEDWREARCSGAGQKLCELTPQPLDPGAFTDNLCQGIHTRILSHHGADEDHVQGYRWP